MHAKYHIHSASTGFRILFTLVLVLLISTTFPSNNQWNKFQQSDFKAADTNVLEFHICNGIILGIPVCLFKNKENQVSIQKIEK